MKKRIVALILSVFTLVACMQIPVAWADGSTNYTLSELLGGYFAIRKTDNTGYVFSSTETAAATKYLSGPTDGLTPLGYVGDAVEVKFKTAITVATTDSKNSHAVTFIINDQDGNRVYMQLHDEGAWLSNTSSNSVNFNATQ